VHGNGCLTIRSRWRSSHSSMGQTSALGRVCKLDCYCDNSSRHVAEVSVAVDCTSRYHNSQSSLTATYIGYTLQAYVEKLLISSQSRWTSTSTHLSVVLRASTLLTNNTAQITLIYFTTTGQRCSLLCFRNPGELLTVAYVYPVQRISQSMSSTVHLSPPNLSFRLPIAFRYFFR